MKRMVDTEIAATVNIQFADVISTMGIFCGNVSIHLHTFINVFYTWCNKVGH